MMRKLFSCVLPMLLIGITNTYGQEFDWGYSIRLDDETEKSISYVLGEDEIVRLSSVYDLDIFNYKISSNTLNYETLDKTNTFDLGISQPIMGSASATHLNMHQRDGTNFIFFSYEPAEDASKNRLFYQEVDVSNGKKSDRKLVTVIEGKSIMNNGQFLTASSENGAFLAVLKEPAFYKKTPQKIEILLFDSSMQRVDSIVHEFPTAAERAPQHMLEVDNSGNVYLIKRFDLKKQKPYHSIFNWKRGSSVLKEHSLKQEDNYQLAQIYPYFHNGIFNMAAILTDVGATTFGMKVDMDGRHSGTSAQALLCTAFSADGTHRYTKRSNFDVVSNLSLKRVHSSEDAHWMVFERMQVEKESSSDDPFAKDVTYSYSYLSNGFMIGLVNPETGELSWSEKIDTQERDTYHDNGAYLSVLSFVNNGNLALLYNVTMEYPDGGGKTYKRRTPNLDIISKSGDLLSSKALTDAGVGVKKDATYDLDTDHMIQLGPNKYLLRGRQGRSHVYKYGVMRL